MADHTLWFDIMSSSMKMHREQRHHTHAVALYSLSLSRLCSMLHLSTPLRTDITSLNGVSTWQSFGRAHASGSYPSTSAVGTARLDSHHRRACTRLVTTVTLYFASIGSLANRKSHVEGLWNDCWWEGSVREFHWTKGILFQYDRWHANWLWLPLRCLRPRPLFRDFYPDRPLDVDEEESDEIEEWRRMPPGVCGNQGCMLPNNHIGLCQVMNGQTEPFY